MSSAPSVPGVEVGAPWLGGCGHVLTVGALEMLAALDGTFGPGRAELPESCAVRDAEVAGGVLPGFLAGTKDARQGDWRLAPGLVDRRVEISGSTDRKMVIHALNCGAKLFMADREGEPMPVARIVQVPDASVQGVPVGRHLADALDGSRQAGLAQHPDGRFGPLAIFTKEYVHARRLPAGL
jgi:malate synthase